MAMGNLLDMRDIRENLPYAVLVLVLAILIICLWPELREDTSDVSADQGSVSRPIP
jgi:hypothetical protein